MKGKIIMGKVNISDYQLSISSEIEKEEMELHLVNGARSVSYTHLRAHET